MGDPCLGFIFSGFQLMSVNCRSRVELAFWMHMSRPYIHAHTPRVCSTRYNGAHKASCFRKTSRKISGKLQESFRNALLQLSPLGGATLLSPLLCAPWNSKGWAQKGEERARPKATSQTFRHCTMHQCRQCFLNAAHGWMLSALNKDVIFGFLCFSSN